jgi:hypothetical protein
MCNGMETQGIAELYSGNTFIHPRKHRKSASLGYREIFRKPTYHPLKPPIETGIPRANRLGAQITVCILRPRTNPVSFTGHTKR